MSRKSPNRQIAQALKAQGKTYSEIGSLLGVSRTRAMQYLMPPCNTTPGPCARCGRNSKHLHRHHIDYSTHVIQLICPSCHAREHNKPHTHCSKGHEFTLDNSVPVRSHGRAQRRCKICKRAAGRKWWKSRKLMLQAVSGGV